MSRKIEQEAKDFLINKFKYSGYKFTESNESGFDLWLSRNGEEDTKIELKATKMKFTKPRQIFSQLYFSSPEEVDLFKKGKTKILRIFLSNYPPKMFLIDNKILKEASYTFKKDRANFLKLIFILASKVIHDKIRETPFSETGILLESEIIRGYKTFLTKKESIIDDFYRLSKSFGDNNSPYCDMLSRFFDNAEELRYLVCFLGRTRKQDERIWALNIDPENIGKIKEKVNCIHLGEILEHVKDPDIVMNCCLFLAEKNTLFIVSVPNFKHKTHLRTYSLDVANSFCQKYFKVLDYQIIKHKHKINNTERYFIWGIKYE